MEKKEPKIKILVACHKADPAIRQDYIYMPIHVGKALHPDIDLGFQGDDTGDNISEKNGSYCELTAMYWAWKNLPKDVDIVGLCHYRRYFDVPDIREYVKRRLLRSDIILPRYRVLPHSIFEELVMLTTYEDVYLMFDSILKLYPEYAQFLYDYFIKNNRFTLCNMFITSKMNFEKYCDFIFSVLGDIEKLGLLGGYSRQKRVLGYLSEALLGFWCYINNLKVKYVPLLETSKISEKRIWKGLSLNLSLRNRILFSLFAFPKKGSRLFEDWILTGLTYDHIIIENKNFCF